MKILVTGAKGFLGKNLVVELHNQGYTDIFEYDRDTETALLDQYVAGCEFVFHLAGVNRSEDEADFQRVNQGLTGDLLNLLRKHGNTCPVVFSSSSQAENDSVYGMTKKAGEDAPFAYGEKTGARIMEYRLSNLFGKWCRPNYNSVVATFCYNIARDLEIIINNPDTELSLCYVDDVVDEFVNALHGRENCQGNFCEAGPVYRVPLGALAQMLYAFRMNRQSLVMPSLRSDFERDLYVTYISYLPEDGFSCRLDKKTDERGWLAKFIKSESFGQIFISKTRPDITRGNHWHHTKVEKFLVIQGQAEIKFRRVGQEEVLTYFVSGDVPEVVDIPTGYTHSITNTGDTELITLFWADETFNPNDPDTYYLEV